ncbi:BTB/POZ domain-containing protein At5g47800-like [Macadamia integrifolia]|uniref:BTB/POZ domain-containing protein At5g47800-like n=1 Tax=Macadamia integrifolia TaxID=60698 RepID=UPI001C52CAFF|nr:BTB/POZ domain-containing protein At5g47800-like [Macadamia integrifolia]
MSSHLLGQKTSRKMKFMKIGNKPDTFYTEEAKRSVASDVPSDLLIQINNTTYHLHKFPLLPKCGLLQRLCSNAGNPSKVPLELHDVPGEEEAFELCAKFCYGITINLSALNFVPAFSAAKFLGMTESVDKGNFVLKLEIFFKSCILEGWKDSIVTLQTTENLLEWAQNLGLIRQCIDSIVEKILTHPSEVTWSYTYTRPGYKGKHHRSVPKDWWTEDISNLDIDLFRTIIAATRSTKIVSPQLIGEALHVYACRWLPETSQSSHPETSASQTESAVEKHRRVLEAIVSMIPIELGSVSIGFLLRLLSRGKILGVSPSTKAELVRRSGRQLMEAMVKDLLFPSHSSSDRHSYDIDLVLAVLESFLAQWRRKTSSEDGESLKEIRKVAQLIDSYLQFISRKDVSVPALKMITLAESLPEIARPKHDELYKAINIYLKEHPDLSKAEKKRLCRILDCRKLSPEVCAHAIRNERLPLRTVVQVLFYEQERGGRPTPHKQPRAEKARGGEHPQLVAQGVDHGKSKLGLKEQFGGAESVASATNPRIVESVRRRRMKSDGRQQLDSERKVEIGKPRNATSPSIVETVHRTMKSDGRKQFDSEIKVEMGKFRETREEGIKKPIGAQEDQKRDE